MNVPEEALDALHAAPIEAARRWLIPFCQLIYPGFKSAKHLEVIARHIEQVDAGALKRLAVLLPPRHGKSVLASQLATAWLLGRDPTRDIIMATHSDELSNRNSRVTRDAIKDPSWPFECSLRQDSFSVGRWNLVEGGGLWACGSDSSITGRGADVLVLDDLQHDSGTAGERAAAWRWYREIATPRLNNNAAIIAIGTRFDEEDLFGRILSGPDAAGWTVLRMPAIAEADDILGREVGEALWPEHVSLSELLSRKRSMGTVWFESQFQQNPVPAEGTMFKKAWFENRYTTLPSEFATKSRWVSTAHRRQSRPMTILRYASWVPSTTRITCCTVSGAAWNSRIFCAGSLQRMKPGLQRSYASKIVLMPLELFKF